MTIVLIGYGKIGAVKANLWSGLGLRVLVYDTAVDKVTIATERGLQAYERIADLFKELHGRPYIIDINTSSGSHYVALKSALNASIAQPSAILIEKPVASSLDELAGLNRLISDYGMLSKTFVNESYFFSKGLLKLKSHIENSGIKSIRINFSKDRTDDVIAGRFNDHNLCGYGIELPHMLACANYLGIQNFTVLKNKLFFDKREVKGEGLVLELSAATCRVYIKQTLGKFRINADHAYYYPHGQVQTSRSVSIETINGETLLLQFDPVPGHPRFVSLFIDNLGRKEVIEDNHMQSSLFSVFSFASANELSDGLSFATFEKGIEAAKNIISLRENAEVSSI